MLNANNKSIWLIWIYSSLLFKKQKKKQNKKLSTYNWLGIQVEIQKWIKATTNVRKFYCRTKNQEKFPFIDSKIALQIKEATRSTKYRCPTGWKPYMTKQTSRTDKRSSQKKTP